LRLEVLAAAKWTPFQTVKGAQDQLRDTEGAKPAATLTALPAYIAVLDA
jgi:hypothetical protein